MADLKRLLEQMAALEKQIEATRREEREQALKQIRELMGQHQLTPADLRPAGAARTTSKRKKPSGAAARKAPVKFRNADTGDAWSGRGLQPRWLKAALAQGRKLDDFKV